MSKRRRASELIFKDKRSLQYPVNVVAALSGTGTVATYGIITVMGTASANTAYLTISSGTNIGTLVGTV